jgi:hypothetical protein
MKVVRPLQALLLLTIAVLIGCGGGGSSDQQVEVALPGPPALSDGGINTSASYARTALIRNEPAWKLVWQEHATTFLPNPPTPTVDFSKYDVVVVISEFENSPSSPPILDRVSASSTAGTIYVTMVHRPGNAGFGARPYLFRAIPKMPPIVTFRVSDAY